MNDIHTTLKLASALRELLDISTLTVVDDTRYKEARKAAVVALAGVQPVEDHSDVLRGMNLAEANWWFMENVSSDDPMRDTYYWLLRERNAEGCSESAALDTIAGFLSGSEWDADMTADIATVIRETGREIEDTPEDELVYLGEPGCITESDEG